MPEEYAEPKKGKSRGKKKKRDTKRRDVIGEVDDETRRRFCHLQDKKPTSLSRSIRRKRKMGRVFVVELEGRTYRCKFCRTHLALVDDLVSRAFHCRKGKAYLFNKVVNTSIGVLEERAMLSGMHTVADIFCCCCGQIVGWKYEAAHERSQKYKEGKFVLERGRIVNGFDSDFYIGNHLGMSDDEE